MTPEGKVKEIIKKVLKQWGAAYHMPVQNGMGAPTLDFNGCHRGYYFTIEAKADGEPATPRQRITMRSLAHAHASVFLIDGAGCDDMLQLLAWLADPQPCVVGRKAAHEMSKTTEPKPTKSTWDSTP